MEVKTATCTLCGGVIICESGFVHICLPPETPFTAEELEKLKNSPHKAPDGQGE